MYNEKMAYGKILLFSAHGGSGILFVHCVIKNIVTFTQVKRSFYTVSVRYADDNTFTTDTITTV